MLTGGRDGSRRHAIARDIATRPVGPAGDATVTREPPVAGLVQASCRPRLVAALLVALAGWSTTVDGSSALAAEPQAATRAAPVVAPSGPAAPWLNTALSADARAAAMLARMSLAEKIGLLHTRFGVPMKGQPKPDGSLDSAGFAPGVPRLGLPPLQETDAGLGVANPVNKPFDATPLPSGLMMAATFDPALAVRAGAMIGGEARALGFSVLLGGGADLTRDARGGRNFEYAGEDPLLAGRIAGATIAGTQSRHIVSTLKHFALNAQENGRVMLSATLDEAAFRESDLLAFEIALETGHPGAVMAAYNRVNGTYMSENAALLNGVLKGDWGFAGWVMSDWSATHSTDAAALAGLDQESGVDNDPQVFFDAPLQAAVEAGRVPAARLDDMVRRILRAQIAAGIVDDPPHRGSPIDFAADADVAKQVAENGIVLLKNDRHVLPLAPGTRRLLVVGGHADQGVLSGGGSSQVVPFGAIRAEGEPKGVFYGKPMLYDPSPPVAALRRVLPGTAVTYMNGEDVAAAAQAAASADAVIVVAEQWMNESRDAPNLSLPHGQDALISAVAAANPRTIVVLETGGPVLMPWLASVPAVLEAWYAGARGGEAIADVLAGQTNPSGHLPMTFPAAEAQLPRPTGTDPNSTLSNPGPPPKGPMFSVDYNIEGPDVGYKWFLRTGRRPLFPFGYGLSYTRFAASRLKAVAEDGSVKVAFVLANTGVRTGIATPQVYLDGAAFTRRLVGFERIALRPGESRRVVLRVDPRLAARFDVAAHGWAIAAGRYAVSVRPDALAPGASVAVTMPARAWPARHGAAALKTARLHAERR